MGGAEAWGLEEQFNHDVPLPAPFLQRVVPTVLRVLDQLIVLPRPSGGGGLGRPACTRSAVLAAGCRARTAAAAPHWSGWTGRLSPATYFSQAPVAYRSLRILGARRETWLRPEAAAAKVAAIDARAKGTTSSVHTRGLKGSCGPQTRTEPRDVRPADSRGVRCDRVAEGPTAD